MKDTSKPFYPEPNMKTGMGAPYVGFYAKTFHASSTDGNYRNRSTLATLGHFNIVREDNNMAGKDADYDQVIPYVTSPIQFPLQQERKPFTKYGVFG